MAAPHLDLRAITSRAGVVTQAIATDHFDRCDAQRSTLPIAPRRGACTRRIFEGCGEPVKAGDPVWLIDLAPEVPLLGLRAERSFAEIYEGETTVRAT